LMLVPSMKARRLTTLPKFKINIYHRCRFEFTFGNWHARYHEIGLLMLIETS
jgi:hypothetical protein